MICSKYTLNIKLTWLVTLDFIVCYLYVQCETATTTTNSSTSSLSASFYSNDGQLGETTSLPNTQLLRVSSII